MTVDRAQTAHNARHLGSEYHFCSVGCLAKFATNHLPSRMLDFVDAGINVIYSTLYAKSFDFYTQSCAHRVLRGAIAGSHRAARSFHDGQPLW